MRVLVAGGTGRLGRIVVARLAAAGITVRVLTRDRGRAETLAGHAVEVVEGDVRHAETLHAAVDQVDVVVSAVQGFAGSGRVTPASVDRDGNANLLAAATAGGASFVLMSIVGAGPDSPMELFRCKYEAEQALRSSGLPWAIVRATAFLELWVELVGHGLVFGRGDNPINFVSVNDVAEVVSQVVLNQSQLGQIIEIGGPEDMSFNDLAAACQELRGTPKRVMHLPRGLLRVMAPIHRQPRAALVMDTTDMTYQPHDTGRVGATSIRQALALDAVAAR